MKSSMTVVYVACGLAAVLTMVFGCGDGDNALVDAGASRRSGSPRDGARRLERGQAPRLPRHGRAPDSRRR